MITITNLTTIHSRKYYLLIVDVAIDEVYLYQKDPTLSDKNT